jgi:MFS transporter, AAHS family, 4-hydroxybenzoate transporter
MKESGMASVVRDEIDVGSLLDNAKVGGVSLAVLALCFCVMLMDGYDYGIMSNAAPVIMKEWSVSPALFGPVFSVATFGWMIGAIVFGALSDRFGRKKTLISGTIIFTTLTLFICFSQTLAHLLIIRFFVGIGVGGAVPVAMVLTSEYSPQKARAKFITIMFSGFVVGMTLGSYMASAMMPVYGWRSLFLIGFFVPLPAIGLLFWVLPESARWLALNGKTEKDRRALIGIIRKAAPELHIDGKTSIVAAAAQKQDRQSLKELFSGRLAWCTPLLWLYYLTSSLALFFINTWSPQLLVLKGLTAAQASSMVGTSGLFGIAGTVLIGLWLDKTGFRWGFFWPLLTVGFTALIGGASGIMLLVWLSINNFLVNGGHSILTAMVPSIYPYKVRAQGTGVANAVARIGSIIGPTLGGLLISTGMAMTTLFYLAAIPFIFCALFCFVLGLQYDMHFKPLYAGKR